MPRRLLRLFISGPSPRSERAVANLREICQRALGDGCEFEIVDVHDQPDEAEAERVIVTPTLIGETSSPGRRIIGDLSDPARVAEALDLDVDPPGPGERTH